jgi:magnesium chelatase accessory protein
MQNCSPPRPEPALVRHELALPRWRVSCLERGVRHPDRPSLVLVHGLMGSAATFAPFLDALPSDRHAIAIDLPGAGASERNRRLSASLPAVSQCVGEILRAMDLDRPVLVGHSHGGAVGLHLAASEPGLIRSLVLLAPAHPYFRHADQIIRFYLSPLGVAFAHTLPWYPQWLQMVGLRRMAGPQSWDTPERLLPYRENLQTRGTIGHLLRLLQTWHSDMRELRHLLEAPFRLPTLLLWGDHDRAVPIETMPALRRRLRRSEVQVLDGVGHRPAEERPEVCAELIEDWCERLPGLHRKVPLSAAD